uniref:aspartate transaminase n=1 Tax=Timema poppense TaxID=170557 RepID=A0A7R9D5M3_TIMPO|nr:unnamed protein product [Timema poppensis]
MDQKKWNLQFCACLSVCLSQSTDPKRKSCVRVMAKRIIDVRQRFRAALEEINTPGNWEHITSQTGMFSNT